MSNSNEIEVRPYTLKELAAIYKMDHRTFYNNWIEPIEEKLGSKKGRYYTIPQVEMIFSLYKVPKRINRDDTGKLAA